MNGNVRRILSLLILCLGLFGASFGAVRLARVTTTKTVAPYAYRPDLVASGPELVVIYIGRSTCSWCRRPELPNMIRVVRDSLQSVATARKQRLVFEGIALDWDVQQGLQHLDHIGMFDQVFAGGGWANELAFKYVWRDLPGDAATPSLLILERTLSVPSGSDTLREYRSSDERVLVRKVGLFDLMRWLNDGVPVPRVTEF